MKSGATLAALSGWFAAVNAGRLMEHSNWALATGEPAAFSAIIGIALAMAGLLLCLFSCLLLAERIKD